MSVLEQGVSDEAAGYLRLILEKCQHIELHVLGWVGRGMTYDLTRDHILHQLIPQVRQYVEVLTCLATPQIRVSLDPELLNPLYRSLHALCKKRTLEVNSLFGLLQDSDPANFDELDAFYAKRFIIDDEPSSNPRDATNFTRTALEMKFLVRSWLGPPSGERNTTWGLPGHLPDLPAVLAQRFAKLAQSVIDQSKPRYIHKYPGLPPYQWDTQVGPRSGSFGVVIKATSQLTGEVVAIKSISRCLRDEERLSVDLELGTVEICDHPNLIKLVDAYETLDNTIHLVLTPWAPFTLHGFLFKRDPDLSSSCPWFAPQEPGSTLIIFKVLRGLADGLDYLHRMSIKHKDIKPQNILLHHEGSRDICPIIADFGTSKVFKTGGSTRFTDSTYTYLAPEQVGHTESSLKSDIWQLGCCFAQVLARACGGRLAVCDLEASFCRSPRSCQISSELGHFLPALRHICAAQPAALRLICGMLERVPAARWNIEQVRDELGKVISVAEA